mmetsp:Transcript_41436/g.54522  ORF Transcript_41436/g.54522 Transcript_41436/m.54522 type:complete len:98 (+) Transcript_41436:30-323(+)
MQTDVPSATGGSRLASNKYFKPQELNDLARVGKPTLTGVRKSSAAHRKGSANQRQPPGAGQPATTGIATKRSLVVRGGGDLKKVEAPKTINYSESTR